MARKPIIPDYDRVLPLADVADKARCSTTKAHKAQRYGHLIAMRRASSSQPLRFLLTDVTAWINEGAGASRPSGYRPERAEPEHLRRGHSEINSTMNIYVQAFGGDPEDTKLAERIYELTESGEAISDADVQLIHDAG